MPQFLVECDGKYAVFSTIVDNFITPFNTAKEENYNIEMEIAEAIFHMSLNKSRKRWEADVYNLNLDKDTVKELINNCVLAYYIPYKLCNEKGHSKYKCPNCSSVVPYNKESCECGIWLDWETWNYNVLL